MPRHAADAGISRCAAAWRRADQAAIADNGSRAKQRAEYRARQQLREAIDTAAAGIYLAAKCK